MDRVHPDFSRCQIDRSRFGHATQRPFRGTVGDRSRGAAQTRDRRDIDDRSATRSFHQRDYRLHAEEAAKLVDPHVALEQGGVGFHQSFRLVDAGVVHQTVQAAKFRRGFDCFVPIRFGRHVLGYEPGRGAKFVCQLPAFGFQHVANDDAGAFGDE